MHKSIRLWRDITSLTIITDGGKQGSVEEGMNPAWCETGPTIPAPDWTSSWERDLGRFIAKVSILHTNVQHSLPIAGVPPGSSQAVCEGDQLRSFVIKKLRINFGPNWSCFRGTERCCGVTFAHVVLARFDTKCFVF